ncbi:hypothetical protein LX32DRAFT_292596 [Colletotrichum zoysiae]|uniref:Uncharacterized protein n=1 Tax=Colletotrichum zoysiae TaxID=1216348 RepID=A0AAD9HMW2_9PEZI|nr:hypothetical protein LX32DRAFT_292596 [Colletotrichum zoysiae]
MNRNTMTLHCNLNSSHPTTIGRKQTKSKHCDRPSAALQCGENGTTPAKRQRRSAQQPSGNTNKAQQRPSNDGCRGSPGRISHVNVRLHTRSTGTIQPAEQNAPVDLATNDFIAQRGINVVMTLTLLCNGSSGADLTTHWSAVWTVGSYEGKREPTRDPASVLRTSGISVLRAQHWRAHHYEKPHLTGQSTMVDGLMVSL